MEMLVERIQEQLKGKEVKQKKVPWEFVYVKNVVFDSPDSVPQVFCTALAVNLVLLGVTKHYRITQTLEGDLYLLTNDVGWEGMLEIYSWCKGKLWNLTDFIAQFPSFEERNVWWELILRRSNPEKLNRESAAQQMLF